MPTTRPPRKAPPTTGRVLVAVAGLVAALVGATALERVRRRHRPARAGEGHPAPDLAADLPHPGPDHRAPDAFRPDPTAPVPASEREALRPATGAAPTLAEDRGAARSLT